MIDIDEQDSDFDINSFKTAIINKIAENNEIINILDENCIDAGGKLLYKKIFPFLQNPKTVEDTAPFICIKVDHDRNVDEYLEIISVVIYVVCHEKGMSKRVKSYRTQEYLSGTVIDILGEEIKKTISGMDSNWIGKLKCIGNREETLYYDFPSRKLMFTAYKETYGNK